MARRVIGKVTEEEKKEMLILYETAAGLEELGSTFQSDLLTMEEKERFLHKMQREEEKTRVASNEWWSKMEQKYQWTCPSGHQYYLDFDSCGIYLED